MDSLYKSAACILVGLSLVNCNLKSPNISHSVEKQVSNKLVIDSETGPSEALSSDTKQIHADLVEYKIGEKRNSCTKRYKKRRTQPYGEKEEPSEQREGLSGIANGDGPDKSENLQQQNKGGSRKPNYERSNRKAIRPTHALLFDPPPIATPPNMFPLEHLKANWDKMLANISSYEIYSEKKDVIFHLFSWRDKVRVLIHQSEDNSKLYAISAFADLYPYIEKIIRAGFFDTLSEDDRLMLVRLFYGLNFDIAVAYLMLLGNDPSRLNKSLILKYTSGYKGAKERLKVRCGVSTERLGIKYLNCLSRIYDEIKNHSHQAHNFFYPQQASLYQQRTKPSLRMLEVKRRSEDGRWQELYGSIPTTIANDTDIFLKEQLELITALNQKDTIFSCKELCNRYAHLEKSALRMVISERTSFKKHNKSISDFTPECWANLYVGMQECLPRIDIYGFIRNGIVIYFNANQPDKAKLRLEAMDCFYAEKASLLSAYSQRDFETFRALLYAFYGEYDKLSQLYRVQIKRKLDEINTKLLHRNKLTEKHRQKVEQIKSMQKTRLDLGFTGPTFAKKVQGKQVLNMGAATSDFVSEAAYQEAQQQRKQEAEDRIKRHQNADNERKQKEALDEPSEEAEKKLPVSQPQELEVQPTRVAIPECVATLHFSLSKKSYNTVSKILDNNWNITRLEIEGLFNELGQTINETTKSSHHVIKLHEAIMLVNHEGKVLGVVSDLSSSVGGHLSLPDWEEIVPKYLRAQIERLLVAIGINRKNCSKANVDERTQYIPVQIQSNSSRVNSQNKSVSNKKKSKRKKKMPRTS